MKHIKMFEEFIYESPLDKVLSYLKKHKNRWDSGECGNLALTISKVLPDVTFYHSADKDHIMWSVDDGKTLYDGLGKPIYDDGSGDIMRVYPEDSIHNGFTDFAPDPKVNGSGITGILSKIDSGLYNDLINA